MNKVHNVTSKHRWRRLSVGTMLLAATVANFGCTQVAEVPRDSRKAKTMEALVEHLKANGYDGQLSIKKDVPTGAHEGGVLKGDDFAVDVYRFLRPDKASSFVRSQKELNAQAYSNGGLVLVVIRGDDKLVEAFKSF